MSAIGIIAEFNPLHNGHKYIIDRATESGKTVICAISGNFVQRGETAIVSKEVRARMALSCGADIVVELPVLWSMSTAQNFALGGVWQLYNCGCDEIIFGSECGDIKKLYAISDILLSEDFDSLVSEEIKKGITFAVARESAVKNLGGDIALLKNANDNLGIEYIVAARKLNLDIKFSCVKRQGAGHDQGAIDNFASASFIREKIKNGECDELEEYMPDECIELLKNANLSDMKLLERAILSSLRLTSKQDFRNLPDLSEGLDNALFASARQADSYDELCDLLKSKRYTLARVRRLILSAYLRLDDEFFMKAPPYVRILGFNKFGERHLKEFKSTLPLIKRVAEISTLGKDAIKILETESRATDIFSLSLENPQTCGAEYTFKLIKDVKND